MITFAFAIVLMLATPGPGVLSAAGVSAGFGAAAGLRYVAGLCIGKPWFMRPSPPAFQPLCSTSPGCGSH